MYDNIFDSGGGDGFFAQRHAESAVSAEEKKRRRAERARVQRGLNKRGDWTPEMHAAEEARIRAEVDSILAEREGNNDAA